MYLFILYMTFASSFANIIREQKSKSLSGNQIDSVYTRPGSSALTCSREKCVNLLSKGSTLTDGIGLLHVENNLLKERIKNLEASEASLKEKADINLKMYQIEVLNNQIFKDREKNSDLVNNFIMETLQNIEMETNSLKNTIQEQNKLIKEQEVENQYLNQVVLSLESLMKEEEKKKKRLKNIALNEKKICKNYETISKFDMKAPDYLGFVNDMVKTIKTQHSQIEDFRSQFDYEKAAALNVQEVLTKLAVFNLNDVEKNNFEDLSKSFNLITETQSKSLETMIPYISYIIGNNSGLHFEEDSNGNILQARQCYCIPEAPKSSKIQPVSVQYQCPKGKLSSVDEGPTFYVPCSYDNCPSIIEETCFLDDNDGDSVDDAKDNCLNIPNSDQLDTDDDGVGDLCDSDKDGDNIINDEDNCPATSNSDQLDTDNDGLGNVCDSDIDGDGIDNDEDNCPLTFTSDQLDTDKDGFGNECDSDIDNDGIVNDEDNCPLTFNSDQVDTDKDGFGDACDSDKDGDGIVNDKDNCPLTMIPDQLDTDEDGVGDLCDSDKDGDGIVNREDNCPLTFNSDQVDTDKDSFGDVCDSDKDGDGIVNQEDNCPLLSNLDQLDRDEDGFGDLCDSDKDGDGILNEKDNCPLLSNLDQLDTDEDGLGDLCDSDKDGDGIINQEDNCPPVHNPDQIDLDNDGQGDKCDDDDDGDGVLDKDDNCPHNSQISSTDFSAMQAIDFCSTHKMRWEFRDGGKEIWQDGNKDGGIAIGQDILLDMDFSGTISVDTNGHAFIGFVFSFQNPGNFFVVFASRDGYNNGQWKIVKVSSPNGLTKKLRSELWRGTNIPGRIEIVWQDPEGRGWKYNTPYRYLVQHRPTAGTIRLQIHEGITQLFDTGDLNAPGLSGGRVGVFCISQPRVRWSNMSYICVEE